MPELPEVETVVRTLRPRLVAAKLLHVRHLRDDMLRPGSPPPARVVKDATVAAVERRGKKILIRLSTGHTLGIHLGMTGQITISPPSADVRNHTHLILPFRNGAGETQELRFRDPRRFGEIWLCPPGQCAEGDELGPEPLTLTTRRLATRLVNTTRPLKNALMDQTLIAGLGNIYVDESLFAAGLHPLTPANTLTRTQTALLNKSIKRILRTAIRRRGSSISDYIDVNGASGAFQHLHRVYARTGKPCRTCKTKIERIVLAGRSTHFCPKCQPR
jgi:formamidopyrimidine-DNA glycosylase